MPRLPPIYFLPETWLGFAVKFFFFLIVLKGKLHSVFFTLFNFRWRNFWKQKLLTVTNIPSLPMDDHVLARNPWFVLVKRTTCKGFQLSWLIFFILMKLIDNCLLWLGKRLYFSTCLCKLKRTLFPSKTKCYRLSSYEIWR